jgi:D-glycero-D-manno-heptose 1,7-bisphosphate phosphatase
LVNDATRRPAVFLDRDGTVTEEVGYLNHVSRLRLLSGAPEAIRRLNQSALPVILVTNQSGVGRGYFPEALVLEIHDQLKAELAKAGARIDGLYYCPHISADKCECRKPKTGMLERAASEFGLDLKKSFVVGDRHSDVELAYRAGARSIFVRTGYGEGELAWHAKNWPRQPEFIAVDLLEAVHWILGETQQ